jgi:hypothetical protein
VRDSARPVRTTDAIRVAARDAKADDQCAHNRSGRASDADSLPLTVQERYGFRALTWAVQRGHAGVVPELLAAGANPDLPGPTGEAPLVTAARRGSPACVRALLDHGAGARWETLAEARRWLTLDVAAELRAGLEAAYGPGHKYVSRRWEQEPGTETVEVALLRDGRPAAANDQQTGHRVIVGLLEAGPGALTG